MSVNKKISLPPFSFLLPFAVLAVTLGIKMYFYTAHGTEYWLDEIIVTAVSRQPLKLLLDSVSAEPHPPGFYLFMKLLPVSNMLATRLILVALCYALTAMVLVFGYAKGIIQRFRLQYGLSLFFATYSFLEISSHVRLEILSFPLMLLFLLLAAYIWDNASVSRAVWIAFALSLTVLMTVGYIYYFFCLAFGIALFVRRRHPVLLAVLLTQAVLAETYFLLFGRFQMLANLGRFSWLGDHSNSLIDSLLVSLAGRGSGELIGDVIVLAFLYLIISSIPSLRGKNPLVLPVAFAAAALVILSYPLHLNVRSRYSALLILLLCIGAGWRILEVKKSGLWFAALMLILLYSGLVSFRWGNVGMFRQPLGRIFADAAKGEKFGYIEDSATLQFAHKIEYIPEDNIIPVNIHFPGLSRGPYSINKTLLAAEGKAPLLTENILRNNLDQLDIHNFFYMNEFLEKGNYIDEDKLLLRVLDTYCAQRESRKFSSQFILFTYRKCTFLPHLPYE